MRPLNSPFQQDIEHLENMCKGSIDLIEALWREHPEHMRAATGKAFGDASHTQG